MQQQQRYARGRQAFGRQRFKTLTEKLEALDGPLSADTVASLAAREIIRRLKLEDDKATWAKIKSIVQEAVALPIPVDIEHEEEAV